MPSANVEIVRRMYESFNRVCAGSDLRPYIEEFFTEEIVFETGGTAGWALEGSSRGHDGIRRFYESWLDVIEDAHVEPLEIIEAGDRVAVPVHLTGGAKFTGIEADVHFIHVFTMRDGKAARLQMFGDRAEALAEIGLTG